MSQMQDTESVWAGDFGKQYTERNPHTVGQLNRLYKKLYGVTAESLFSSFLDDMPRHYSILEIGCGSGTNLALLREMGFTNLYGVDIQKLYIQELSLQASAMSLSFRDNAFDLIFTAGLLIHIPPYKLDTVLDEIFRCTKHYIFGLEYFSEQHEALIYRGQNGLMWKGDFRQMFLDRFYALRLIKSRTLQYKRGENVDMMYLLGLG